MLIGCDATNAMSQALMDRPGLTVNFEFFCNFQQCEASLFFFFYFFVYEQQVRNA